MAFKEKFTEKEWQYLEKAPFLVFTAVANADGTIDKKEIKAFHKVLQNYTELQNDLSREILQSVAENFNEDDVDLSNLNTDLAKVTKVLETKVSYKDALNFKKTLIALGIHIGNSSGGIFSSKFSDEEVEALKTVGTSLGVSESQLQQSPSIKELITSFKR